MPNRIIKESVNESRGLSCCTFFAQDMYKRLITYADDYGRFNADPEIMLARLYPRDLLTVSVCDINDALIELSGVGKVAFYTSEPRREVFACFPNWSDHQRIRDSKRKMPDPTDTKVNDWYYRRFIPLNMKITIIERDGFRCKICGEAVAQCADARRIAKMGAGIYHIDHIVPCQQGGRATLENLRLTCAKCNLSRRKSFTIDEIVQFSENRDDSPQVAASRGLIQSESESESVSESNPKGGGGGPRAHTREDAPENVGNPFGDGPPPEPTVESYIANELPPLSPGNIDQLTALQEAGMQDDAIKLAVDTAAANNRRTWAYTHGILRRWEAEGVRTAGAAKAAEVEHQARKERNRGTDHRQSAAGNAGRREGATGSAGDRYKPDPAEVERIARERGILP